MFEILIFHRAEVSPITKKPPVNSPETVNNHSSWEDKTSEEKNSKKERIDKDDDVGLSGNWSFQSKQKPVRLNLNLNMKSFNNNKDDSYKLYSTYHREVPMRLRKRERKTRQDRRKQFAFQVFSTQSKNQKDTEKNERS